MNWTGGTLQRHSKGSASKALIAKQKQHFANARTTTQHNPDLPLTFKPSFISENDSSSHDVPTSKHQQAHSRTSHMRLEDYKCTRPLAERLSSIQPRRSGQSYQTEKSRLRGHDDRDIQKFRFDPSRRKQFQDGRPKEPSFDRRSLPSNPPDAPLAERRRQLLQQSDWVGLQTSHPAATPFEFEAATQREKVGRRRGLTEKDLRHRASHNQRLRVPSIGEDYTMSGALVSNGYFENGKLILNTRVGTSWSPNAGEAALNSSQMASVDSMLMDAHDGDAPLELKDRQEQEVTNVSRQKNKPDRRVHKVPLKDTVCSSEAGDNANCHLEHPSPYRLETRTQEQDRDDFILLPTSPSISGIREMPISTDREVNHVQGIETGRIKPRVPLPKANVYAAVVLESHRPAHKNPSPSDEMQQTMVEFQQAGSMLDVFDKEAAKVTHGSPKHPPGRQASQEAEDLWRKFVFGSNSSLLGSQEQDFTQVHDNFRQKVASQDSVVAHASSEHLDLSSILSSRESSKKNSSVEPGVPSTIRSGTDTRAMFQSSSSDPLTSASVEVHAGTLRNTHKDRILFKKPRAFHGGRTKTRIADESVPYVTESERGKKRLPRSYEDFE